MIDRMRTLLVIVEEGSVSRAAVRLRITQPALSRQMKALEAEIGGRLLEREPSGVKPTALGHSLIQSMSPVVAKYEAVLAEVKRQARGSNFELRVGYLISAAKAVLTPALARFRKAHPGLKLVLHDMSPRQQIDALKAGDLDIALIGQEGAVAAREFHSATICSLGVCAGLSDSDPLAARRTLAISDLRRHGFVGIDEDQMPGRNRWMTTLCRSAGFKPRFAVITDGITHVLSQVASESAVTLLPDYFQGFNHPGVTFVPISDAHARWDFILLWQRGRVPTTTRALVDALKAVGEQLGRLTTDSPDSRHPPPAGGLPAGI
jgi:DNA-binding transcriptional LysR family regulator